MKTAKESLEIAEKNSPKENLIEYIERQIDWERERGNTRVEIGMINGTQTRYWPEIEKELFRLGYKIKDINRNSDDVIWKKISWSKEDLEENRPSEENKLINEKVMEASHFAEKILKVHYRNLKEFKEITEQGFLPGMNWENFGTYWILRNWSGHIMPTLGNLSEHANQWGH